MLLNRYESVDTAYCKKEMAAIGFVYVVPSLAAYMPKLSSCPEIPVGNWACFEIKNFSTFSADMKLTSEFINRAADRLAAGESEGPQ